MEGKRRAVRAGRQSGNAAVGRGKGQNNDQDRLVGRKGLGPWALTGGELGPEHMGSVWWPRNLGQKVSGRELVECKRWPQQTVY